MFFYFFSDKNSIYWLKQRSFHPAHSHSPIWLKFTLAIKTYHIIMSVLRKSIAYIFIFIWYVLFSIKSIDGRVAGKVGGGAGNYHSGELFLSIWFNKNSISMNIRDRNSSICVYQLNRKFNLKMKIISIFAYEKRNKMHCTCVL